jgi:uncharacterized membrane protein YfbV (UPF0208 family)
MKLTLKLHENIKEVELALPKIQADHDNLQSLTQGLERYIKQYEEALATSQESWDTEKKISKLVVKSIGRVVMRMEENPSNKALADVMNKTAVRNIRIAMKLDNTEMAISLQGKGIAYIPLQCMPLEIKSFCPLSATLFSLLAYKPLHFINELNSYIHTFT